MVKKALKGVSRSNIIGYIFIRKTQVFRIVCNYLITYYLIIATHNIDIQKDSVFTNK